MSEEMTEVAAQAVDEAIQEAEELSVRHELPWFRHVALSTTVIAVLCALTSYFTGEASDKATLERTKEIVRWQALEGERVEQKVIESRDMLLVALGRPVPAPDAEARKRLDPIEREDMAEFTQARLETERLYDAHDVMAAGMTLFQLAIALGAISILLRRRSVWLVGLVFGAAAVICTVAGHVWFEHLLAQMAAPLDLASHIDI